MAFDWQTALGLVAVVALVLLNGFFVAAEFAIVKVRATQLAARMQAGDRRARLASHLVEHLDAYLSATQLGITLASLGLGWIGEPALAHLIEGPLARLGVVSEAAVHAIAFAVAFSVITVLHIVIGELAPKSLAIQRAEPVTLWAARPLHWFYLLFKPAIWLLNGTANRLLRAVGLPPATEGEMLQSEEELRILLADESARKAVGRYRADVILGVFQLKDLEARHIMTPRTRMVALDETRPYEENMLAAEESGYSRFPVVRGDPDEVVGMVHYRDLVALGRVERPQRTLSAVMRPVAFVPETKAAEDTMRELLRRGRHMAIVLDEHGSVAGLLTLEDIFEELFGEIRDEFDEAEQERTYRRLGNDHFLVEGHMPLHQAEAVLGVTLESADVTTVSGFVVEELGRLPQKGERVRVGPYVGLVREVDRRRIQQIELWRDGHGGAPGASS